MGAVSTDADKSIALYVFISADGESGYITRSLFRDSNDYTEGQHRFTILSKDKVNIKTQECERLFTYERRNK